MANETNGMGMGMGMPPADAAMGDPAMMGAQPGQDFNGKLQEEMVGLDTMKQDIQAKQAISQQRLQEVKAELIQSLFEMLQGLGVDPSNIDSIREFLQNLERQDPDLAEIFQIAFTGLVGEEAGAEQQQGMSTEPAAEADGLMNKYNNLADSTMR